MTDTTQTERPAGWFDQPGDATPEQRYAMERTASEAIRRTRTIVEAAMDAERRAVPEHITDDKEKEAWQAGWRSAVISVATSLMITFDQMAAAIDGQEPQTAQLLAQALAGNRNVTVELIESDEEEQG